MILMRIDYTETAAVARNELRTKARSKLTGQVVHNYKSSVNKIADRVTRLKGENNI